eukprot:GHVH01002408.1.p1 GENE.GHVH01002408.1~~GHVH01002408.1.p1  ORF type:complete len:513 (+),score=89.29 GHVH01002408.1:9-1547(+)
MNAMRGLHDVASCHAGRLALSYGAALWNSMDEAYALALGSIDQSDSFQRRRCGIKRVDWSAEERYLSRHYDVWTDSRKQLRYSPKAVMICDDDEPEILNEDDNHALIKDDDTETGARRLRKCFGETNTSDFKHPERCFLSTKELNIDDMEDSLRHQLDCCDLIERYDLSLDSSSPDRIHSFQDVVLQYVSDETPKVMFNMLCLDRKCNSDMMNLERDVSMGALIVNIKDSKRGVIQFASVDGAEDKLPVSTVFHPMANLAGGSHDLASTYVECVAMSQRMFQRTLVHHGGLRAFSTLLLPPESCIADLQFGLLPTDLAGAAGGMFGGVCAKQAVNLWTSRKESIFWRSSDFFDTVERLKSITYSGLTAPAQTWLNSSLFPNASPLVLSTSNKGSSEMPIPLPPNNKINDCLPNFINPLGQLEAGDTDYGARSDSDRVEMMAMTVMHQAVVPGSASEGGNGHGYTPLKKILSSLEKVSSSAKFKPVLNKLGLEHDEVVVVLNEMKEYFVDDLC